MSGSPPLVVIIAGPNGSGKSTTAPRLLQGALAVGEFVNADSIAQGLSAFRPESVAITAGRAMLQRLRALAVAGDSFAFETTLATRTFAPWLRTLRQQGYCTHLVFLALPSPELAVARVAERVRQGGHAIPEDVIRRRFQLGLDNFFELYEGRVDSWQVFDNAGLAPRLIASRQPGGPEEVSDLKLWHDLKKHA
jgi:predicted ABC-type ATPase